MRKKHVILGAITAVGVLAAGTKIFALDMPERFTGDWTGVNDLITVRADAEFILPQTDTISAASTDRRSFTQEDVDRMMEVFLKGNAFYAEQEMTRQQAAERLEKYQAMERGEIPLTGDTTMEKLPDLIRYYTELERTAPDEGERTPASREFVSDGNRETVVGYGEAEGRTMHLFVQNAPDSWDQAICFAEGYGNLMSAFMMPVNPDTVTMALSEEEAVRIGDALLTDLGLGQAVCDQALPIAFCAMEEMDNNPSDYDAEDIGYELQYVRTVGGLPIRYTKYAGTAVPEYETYTGVWSNEIITVYVKADGVVYFRWVSPHTEPVIETQDVSLLDFSDIGDIFGKMVMVKNSYLEKSNEMNGMRSTKEIAIDCVELNLMRIRNKEDLYHGHIVPVWDFLGTTTFFADANSEGSAEYGIVLTINAIDGTMVDRELGY